MSLPSTHCAWGWVLCIPYPAPPWSRSTRLLLGGVGPREMQPGCVTKEGLGALLGQAGLEQVPRIVLQTLGPGGRAVGMAGCWAVCRRSLGAAGEVLECVWRGAVRRGPRSCGFVSGWNPHFEVQLPFFGERGHGLCMHVATIPGTSFLVSLGGNPLPRKTRRPSVQDAKGSVDPPPLPQHSASPDPVQSKPTPPVCTQGPEGAAQPPVTRKAEPSPAAGHLWGGLGAFPLRFLLTAALCGEALGEPRAGRGASRPPPARPNVCPPSRMI